MLVGDNFDAKVADFGVSLAAKKSRGSKKQISSIDTTQEAPKVEGTDFYMAPELFFVGSGGGQLQFSLESDIYAFGIVLYEVFNRCNLLCVGGADERLVAMSDFSFASHSLLSGV